MPAALLEYAWTHWEDATDVRCIQYFYFIDRMLSLIEYKLAQSFKNVAGMECPEAILIVSTVTIIMNFT